MKKVYVIGYPIKHSLSPILHNYWLKKLGIDDKFVYEALEVKPEALKATLERFKEDENILGCNVTIPHKEAALKLSGGGGAAFELQAANTLITNKSIITAKNTDWIGFKNNITPFVKGRGSALVLGAGGSARAILYALVKMQFKNIIVANRTLENAQRIVFDVLRDKSTKSGFEADINNFANDVSTEVMMLDQLEKAGQPDLIVNTTSLGMQGQPPLLVPDSILGQGTVVTDIVYTPLETPLLKQAHDKGLTAIDGLGMLIHQAAPGFEMWFGHKPPIDGSEKELLIEHLNKSAK